MRLARASPEAQSPARLSATLNARWNQRASRKGLAPSAALLARVLLVLHLPRFFDYEDKHEDAARSGLSGHARR